MLSILYFDYFPVTKKVMLYHHPHTLCDGVIVEKKGELFVFYANAHLCHSVSKEAILAKLGRKHAQVSEHLCDLIAFLGDDGELYP